MREGEEEEAAEDRALEEAEAFGAGVGVTAAVEAALGVVAGLDAEGLRVASVLLGLAIVAVGEATLFVRAVVVVMVELALSLMSALLSVIVLLLLLLLLLCTMEDELRAFRSSGSNTLSLMFSLTT